MCFKKKYSYLSAIPKPSYAVTTNLSSTCNTLVPYSYHLTCQMIEGFNAC